MPTDIQALREAHAAITRYVGSTLEARDIRFDLDSRDRERLAMIFNALPGLLDAIADRDRLARRVERAERLQQQLAARTAEVETLREELRARS